MYRFFCQLIVVLFAFTILNGCITNKPDLPEKKRTVLELYLTAPEAVDFLQKQGTNTLFIDVRTSAELTNGMPALADAHVPVILKRDKTQVVVNNDFVSDIEDRLEEKGLDKQNPIVLICHQGNRSAMATNMLAKVGYKNVYHIIDGAIGWQKNNLPWIVEVDKDKLYF